MCDSMKYLISITLLLVLCGCESTPSGSKDKAKVVASSGGVTSGEKLDNPVKEELMSHVARPGLYRLVRSGGVVNDPTTGTGKAVAKPVVEHVRTTERIPLIKGGQMYMQYRIWPVPSQPAYAELRRVLKHPKMTLPDGSISTGSDYMIKVRVSSNQVIAYTGYGLDEDYELVEGDWVFEIWYGDRKMIEQKFTTYQPDKEERAKLEPILALGNRAVGQVPSTRTSFSRFDWPRIHVNVGGEKSPMPAEAPKSPEPTGSLNESSGSAE